MSAWLIAAVGVVYMIVAVEQYTKGNWPMGIVWMGYSIAQVGLWRVSQ